MNKAWWKESVVYQIYPQSFYDTNGDGIGDIKGIIKKLDYLKELGVDVLWISPMLTSPLDDNGYDISDYRDINNIYGDLNDYKELLKQAHERNIKVLMDLVVNHSSDEHNWFVESRKSKDNPYRDYYIWKDGKDGKEPNNWGSIFGGSAWQLDEQTGMYYLHLFTKKQPDLNWESKALRKEVYDMMTSWCEMGVDGFRMDVISLISKAGYADANILGSGTYGNCYEYCVSGPKVHEYLQEMNREVLSKYDLMTVGETAGVTIEQAKKYANADNSELNMVFQFEHIKIGDGKLGKFTTKRYDFDEFKKVTCKWQTELKGKAWNSVYLGNHDQPRSLSRFGDDSPEYREICAKMLATFNLSLSGTPYVYQGEELGMTNAYFDKIEDYKDIETIQYYNQYTQNGSITKEEMMECLKLRSRDNARTPMHWDASENAGFTTGTPWIKVIPNYTEINAQEQISRKNSVLNYYKEMICARKANETLIYGDFICKDIADKVFAYERVLGSEEYLVICNFSAENKNITIPTKYLGEVIISNYDKVNLNENYELRAYEAIILKK